MQLTAILELKRCSQLFHDMNHVILTAFWRVDSIFWSFFFFNRWRKEPQ